MRIELNISGKELEDFKMQLEANDHYCPCSLIKSPDTKCMCKEFRELEEGVCECGLYIKYK